MKVNKQLLVEIERNIYIELNNKRDNRLIWKRRRRVTCEQEDGYEL